MSDNVHNCPFCGSVRIVPYMMGKIRCKKCDSVLKLGDVTKAEKVRGEHCPFCASKQIEAIRLRPISTYIPSPQTGLRHCIKCDTIYDIQERTKPIRCFKCERILESLMDCVSVENSWRHRKCPVRRKKSP